MCRPKKPKLPPPPAVPDPGAEEAIEQSNLEARLRRRRAGAAADVLTSPLGIPSSGGLGRAG